MLVLRPLFEQIVGKIEVIGNKHTFLTQYSKTMWSLFTIQGGSLPRSIFLKPAAFRVHRLTKQVTATQRYQSRNAMGIALLSSASYCRLHNFVSNLTDPSLVVAIGKWWLALVAKRTVADNSALVCLSSSVRLGASGSRSDSRVSPKLHGLQVRRQHESTC